MTTIVVYSKAKKEAVTHKKTAHNYNYYTAVQLMLPMDISKKINENDPVVSFAEAMKGMNLRSYVKKEVYRGNQGYDPYMMLNIMLFAEMEGKHSDLREIEKLCKTDTRYMWLSNEQTPSHMAFLRFEQKYLKKSIKAIFFEIASHIANLMGVDQTIQYIDGSKFEANAYKNSFVYKTRVMNTRERLWGNITKTIVLLNQEYGYCFPYHYRYCSQEIGYIVQYLMDIMLREEVEIVYGKGKRKSTFQKYYDKLLEYALKLKEYEENLYICGNRNSYSKTDHDATMMNTKYDYYNQTGISKPCYNIQHAVSGGIVMNVGVYQTPEDTKTYIPFLEQNKEYHGFYPKWAITDAGYGGYDNYFFNVENGIELRMKYNYYAKKNDSEFIIKQYNVMNQKKNEDGYKICPAGKVFDKLLREEYDERGRYLRINQKYGCEGCAECKLRKDCTKSSRRTITINPINEEFQRKVNENLGTEMGKEMKKQRSIQAEGVFGVIKQDRLYTRIKHRGLEIIELEIFNVYAVYNLMKFHNYRLAQNYKA